MRNATASPTSITTDPHGVGATAVPFSGIAIDAQLFDVLPDAYLVLNEHYFVLAINAAYRKLTENTSDSLIGQSVFDINQYGDAQQREARRAWLLDVLTRVRATHVQVSSDILYSIPATVSSGIGVAANDSGRHAPDTFVDRHWRVKAVWIPATQQQSALIILRLLDVTAEKSQARENATERARLRSQAQLRQRLVDDAQETLRAEKDRLEQALAFARIGSWEMDVVSGAIHCTDQCKANFGRPASATFTRDLLFNHLIDARDQARVSAGVDAAIAAKTPYEEEYRTIWPDGSEHWIMVRGNGVYDEEGALLALHGLTLDITDRKLSELESEAAIRTEQAARQASDARVAGIDRFVSSVSHELRSPLAAIQSWLQLIRLNECASDSASAAKALQVIERNTRQLTHMVDDLLDTGAILNGTLNIAHAPVDLGAIAATVAEDIRPAFTARGLTLESEFIDSCLMTGDESRLRQVVWNLLSNALKFTETGRVTLTVQRQGSEVILCVTDTGIGMSDAILQQAFERFQQANSLNSGRVGGLGLGLWLVRQISEAHGGTVAASSDGVGCGATLRVAFPG